MYVCAIFLGAPSAADPAAPRLGLLGHHMAESLGEESAEVELSWAEAAAPDEALAAGPSDAELAHIEST